MKCILVILISSIPAVPVVLLVSSLSSSATLRVPSAYSTIQAGVDAAAEGDTVLVAPGTYTGTGNRDILIIGKDLVVRSEGGADLTVIDCQEQGRGIWLAKGTTLNSLVDGFTIQRGVTIGNRGAGIYCSGFSNSVARVMNCRFIGNGAYAGEHGEPAPGGGLYCEGCEVAGCSFIYNGATRGGGIYLVGGSVSDCVFIGNAGSGGGLYLAGGIVSDCSFTSGDLESPRGNGGGLWLADGEAIRCTFAGITAFSGGGIWSEGGTVTECIFYDNRAEVIYGSWGTGGAAYCSAGDTKFNNCVFYGNSADIDGAGIYVAGQAGVTVENSIVAFNLEHEGVACAAAGEASLSCSDVFANAGGDWVGCIADQLGRDGNFSQDPLFCDPTGGDFEVDADSPCLPGRHPYGFDCGLIGALGSGCNDPTATTRSTWGTLKWLNREVRMMR